MTNLFTYIKTYVILKKIKGGLPEMEKVYTVKQVADLLQVREYTVAEYLRQGKLKGFKVGNRWRIKEEDLKEFVEEN